jgi:hypothetical protein
MKNDDFFSCVGKIGLRGKRGGMPVFPTLMKFSLHSKCAAGCAAKTLGSRLIQVITNQREGGTAPQGVPS